MNSGLLFHFIQSCSSACKESASNTGDPGSLSWSGRFPGEEIGYPLQYSWASLVAQMVKNLPTMLETWVQSLVWAEALEKRMATHSSIFTWEVPRTEEPGRYSPRSLAGTAPGVQKSWTQWRGASLTTDASGFAYIISFIIPI